MKRKPATVLPKAGRANGVPPLSPGSVPSLAWAFWSRKWFRLCLCKSTAEQSADGFTWENPRIRPVGLTLWHPVEIEMPDDEVTVLVACRDGEVRQAFHDGDLGWCDPDGGCRLETEVTHWGDFPGAPNTKL